MAEVLLQSLVVSLAATLAIECATARLCGLRGDRLKMVFLMNVLTNPAAVTIWFLVGHLTHIPLWPVVALLEIAVVLVEARCLQKETAHPMGLSLLLNGISFCVGYLL